MGLGPAVGDVTIETVVESAFKAGLFGRRQGAGREAPTAVAGEDHWPGLVKCGIHLPDHSGAGLEGNVMLGGIATHQDQHGLGHLNLPGGNGTGKEAASTDPARGFPARTGVEESRKALLDGICLPGLPSWRRLRWRRAES